MTWSTSYYHYDALGSARQLTDAAEATTDSYEYDAWGSAVSSSGTTQNTFRWNGRSGYYWDSDSWTNYVRARHYAPSLGRWLSVDPDKSEPGLNVYFYASNRPVFTSDPSGRLQIIPTFQQFLNPNAQCNKESGVIYQFKLSKQAPCPGFFVQKIVLRCEEKRCRGCPKKTPRVPIAEYYEAFELDRDKLHARFRDRSNLIPEWRTCGVRSVTGELRYYCDEDTGDLNRLWQRRQVYGEDPCTLTAGLLPSTDQPPRWWLTTPPVEGPARRFLSGIWCCCQYPDGLVEDVDIDARPRQ